MLPVRATPIVYVVTGAAHERTTSSRPSSPLPVSRCVESSCTRSSRQPLYHMIVLRYAACAAASSFDSSTVCTADIDGEPVVSNFRTSAPRPSGSANRSCWQITLMPLPSVLSSVSGAVKVRRVASWPTWLGAEQVALAQRRVRVLTGDGGPARAGAVEVGSGAAALVDHGAAEEERDDGGGDAGPGVRAAAGRPGPADDGRPREPGSGGALGQGLQVGAHRGGGHVAVLGEAGGGGLQLALGGLVGEPDLARHLLHGDRAQLGEQQHLALGHRQLGERVEGGPRLRVEALVAVPDAGGVAALRVRPRLRPDPGFGVGSTRDLAPVVPRGHEGVAHRAPRGGEVTGQRIGLHEKALARVLVERVELV